MGGAFSLLLHHYRTTTAPLKPAGEQRSEALLRLPWLAPGSGRGVAWPMKPVCSLFAMKETGSSRAAVRKLINSFYQKVDKPSSPQQTNEKINKKEKEGSRVQGDVNDHGDRVDGDGESGEYFERYSEKRAAKSTAESTDLILDGSLGIVPVDEEAKVVEELVEICVLCGRAKLVYLGPQG
ncbi:hypothetical protein NDU88_003512 [Pleurodeles waltl]|uniref:Uncharacterized protein n=1 Tax=Pleurodeles waltl TaxID=8319 RepID=A0AAV7Q9Y5_PLEWA|nr:hypothetical protein NDU88_003512 [Pleurodeles waltl]